MYVELKTSDDEKLVYNGVDHVSKTAESEYGPSFVRLWYQTPTEERTPTPDNDGNSIDVEDAEIIEVGPTKDSGIY